MTGPATGPAQPPQPPQPPRSSPPGQPVQPGQPAGPARPGSPPDSGIGSGYVSAPGITVVTVLVLAALTLTIYCLVVLWPASATATAVTESRLLGARLLLDGDQRLFTVVALAGFLGGLIHSARSLYWYVGNRDLRRSWLLMYASLPFVGGALAVVFYIVLRGGLVTGQTSAAQLNVFGFAAVSALVGLFSPEAAEKLKQIFSTLLTAAPAGRDQLAPAGQASAAGPPVATGLEPDSGAVGTVITISGRNLTGTTSVIFSGATAGPSAVSDTSVIVAVPAGAATGPVRLAVGSMLVSVPGEVRVE
jgi:IPT/TIG domain